MKAIIIKKQADTFTVNTPKGEFVLMPRGNLKKDGVFVGDNVEVNLKEKTIEKVLKRKNLLDRPTVANLSQLIIMIAPVPKPDFSVIDKLLLFCYLSDIKPILCVNKIDIISEDEKTLIENTYKNVCDIVFVSAKEKMNLGKIKSVLKNHISALTGQSAVGKSELLNAIYKPNTAEVGELAKKVARGKHTTRHSELFKLEKDTYLADTPGFSRLDEKFLPVEYFNLRYYYKDFLIYHKNCKYISCSHTNEQNCAVKEAVNQNKIANSRYENYLKIYGILKREQTYAKK